MQLLKALAMMLLFLVAQRGPVIERLPDGIIVSLDGEIAAAPLKVRVQICSENIFRVRATPEADFSTRPSLIADKTEWTPVDWKLKEDGDYVWLETSRMRAKVHRTKGTVAFYDSGGELILGEQSPDGRILTPAIIHEESTHQLHQYWDFAENEAFYGLGQHQNNTWNYKGHSVDLFQHNLVASVPFLVSNRNYGILWDNYSRTKFGDARDYGPISMLKLFDKEGNPGGLSAEYFSNDSFSEPLVTCVESVISHETLNDQRIGWPEGFSLGSGSVQHDGELFYL